MKPHVLLWHLQHKCASMQSLVWPHFLKPEPGTCRKKEPGLGTDWEYPILQCSTTSCEVQLAGTDSVVTVTALSMTSPCSHSCATMNNLWDSWKIRKNLKGFQAPNLTNWNTSEGLRAKSCSHGQVQSVASLLWASWTEIWVAKFGIKPELLYQDPPKSMNWT